MASQGPRGGSTHVDTLDNGQPWSNVGNLLLPDGQYANILVATLTDSNSIHSTGFGFTIPGTATVDGVLVEILGHSNDIAPFYPWVQLIVGGVEQGNNYGSGVDPAAQLDSFDSYKSFGGSSDKWGLSPTPAQVNASDFGVDWKIGDESEFAGGGTFDIDYIRVTVFYTEAGPPLPSAMLPSASSVRFTG